MRFTKMQGAGNDYVYINAFEEQLPADLPELARKISDRNFGVGGDGMILVCPSCDTRYFADDTSIGKEGRRVRCATCGHAWHAVLRVGWDLPVPMNDGLDDQIVGQVNGKALTRIEDQARFARGVYKAVHFGRPAVDVQDAASGTDLQRRALCEARARKAGRCSKCRP